MIQKEYDDDKRHVHVLSYGAGTQSTAMLLMALKGEINGIIPDYVIFSDTGWEPKPVYDWLNKVKAYVKEKFDKEIIFASAGNIYDDTFEKVQQGKGVGNIPFFTTDAARSKTGMLFRQCTGIYKIYPVNKKVRELLGYRPKQRVKEMVHIWKGISTDEIQRVKPSRDKWITAEHPLVDYMDMDRDDCIKYVEDEGLGTPPKSACIGCPYRDDKSWLEMKKNDPEAFAQCVELDEAVRDGLKFNKAYLHRSCVPLKDVEFKEQTDLNMFINECEGMCGM